MTTKKRPGKVIAGIAIAGVLMGGTIIVPQLAIASSTTVTATTALNVRSEPSTNSRVLGVLSSGEQVERRGDPRGEWTPVRYNGKDGWVYSEYTRLGGVDSASGGTATATDAVNVRSGASTLSGILGTLRVGESVSISGAQSGGWVPVSYKGRSGYVYAAYLSFNSSGGAPTTNDGGSGGGGASGSAKATTALNVRSGAGTGYRILGVLSTGESVSTRGGDQGGWTPVTYKGQNAWVSTQYLSTGGGSGSGSSGSQTSTAYTTTDVNLRTGPGLDYRIVRVLSPSTSVALTGLTQNGFSQVDDGGTLRWISTTYISSSRGSTNSGSGSTSGPSAPNGSNSGVSLNTGGSSGLDGLTANGKGIVYTIRQNYPQIRTMYGVRPDPIPDHPSGRAVDIMMPNGSSDAALGDEIAAYLQNHADELNIEYLIWRQRIWINGQGGWTWMADRGGITANHYDHVHVTVNW